MFVKEELYTKEKIINGKTVAKIVREILSTRDEQDREKEHFFVFGLDVKNNIKYIDIVSVGTQTESLVHPRETFRVAIWKNCVSILLAHNHPSGETQPGKADLEITGRLVECGKILSIKVLDHVIVSEDGFTSFVQEGMI